MKLSELIDSLQDLQKQLKGDPPHNDPSVRFRADVDPGPWEQNEAMLSGLQITRGLFGARGGLRATAVTQPVDTDTIIVWLR